jgi:hypothetical protein
MLEIEKVAGNSKNILVNGEMRPACFIADTFKGKVRILSTLKFITGIAFNGIPASQIIVDGTGYGDVKDCIAALNSFIGSFKSGGGSGVSPEVLAGYVKDVPNPEIVSSEIIDTNIFETGSYGNMGIASNGRTYFFGEYANGIKVLNDTTGIIEDTNITEDYWSGFGIASNGKTYFGGRGIYVLNDATGEIVDVNAPYGSNFHSMIIASNGKTYFIGSNSIYVLNDATGEIVDLNTEETNRFHSGAAGIASDGRTYFLSNEEYGIKVLNDTTGIIEDTNITEGYYSAVFAFNGRTYFTGHNNIKALNNSTGEIERLNITDSNYFIGTGSDGKTYFLNLNYYGIKVLNEATGEIEDTNVQEWETSESAKFGTASDGKTYFLGLGIKVLQLTYSDEKYVRKHGEWQPVDLSEQDASETVISGISVAAKRRGNKVYYLAQDIFKFKIDDSLNLNAVPYNRGQMRFEDSTSSIYFSSVELMFMPIDTDNPDPNNKKEVQQINYYYGGAGTTYLNLVDMDKRPYEICVQTPLGNVFTIKMSYAIQSDFFIVELTKIN